MIQRIPHWRTTRRNIVLDELEPVRQRLRELEALPDLSPSDEDELAKYLNWQAALEHELDIISEE